MKIKYLLVSIFLIAGVSLVSVASAQDQKNESETALKTESFKVSGACGMCKARIEKTAKAEGVNSAAWDSKTQMLTVSYDPSKTNKDALSKKIASVGHDTEKYKAPDEVYAGLPGCCHYDRTK